jgi:hypothetical protein
MRRRVTSDGMTLQVVAGNHAVFLGFDLDTTLRAGCLGFAVHREDKTENEQYFLSGFKTFRSVVPTPDAKVMYSSRDHPVQSFWWGDYTAKPSHDYAYRVVPRYGTPKNLSDQPGVEATVEVSTDDPTQGTHGVYFNRGVAASQAYVTKFGLPPDKLPADMRDKAMAWLSRGLDEALVGFIAKASSPGTALRAAAFEFTEPGVLGAFAAAHTQGADVQVIYHDKDDSTGATNRKAITNLNLPAEILLGRQHPVLAHNKFIIRCAKSADGSLSPESVWTGSTNMSEGGIFGHSNVGHEIRDPDIAARYLDYWHQLSGDPDATNLQNWVSTNNAFVADAANEPGAHALFSPRHGLSPLTWYGQRFGAAQGAAHITLPFGMTSSFESVLTSYTGDALHFVMLDKHDDHQDQWSADKKVLVAVGASGGPDQLSRWAEETLTNFNPLVRFLHTKILLIDPLGAEPTVITGSANFSPNSTNANDENMLVIRGDRDLADVYFTEYSRMFQHFYARWLASKFAVNPHGDVHSFLVEDATWQEPYFDPANVKNNERLLFASNVAGNT